METKEEQIAQKNDALRTSMVAGRGNKIVLTEMVRALPGTKILLKKISEVEEHAPADDPHGEHDFGAVQYEGQKYFWKIDYYDKSLEHGMDALDPSCRRVLTIMHSSEY